MTGGKRKHRRKTCFLVGAVVAGAYPDCEAAQRAMTGLKPRVFKPAPAAHAVYRELYTLYKQFHDAFGTAGWNGNLSDMMKELIAIRQRARD